VLRFANGFQLDDEQTALDEIAKAGLGGNFLSSPSTLRNYKTGYYTSPLYPRWSMEKWQAAGQPEARSMLCAKTQALMENLSTHEDC
jgi:trimethylamine--corrinoid protein Co-methyltransferase